MNVKIIYDSKDPKKRRFCFWESVKEQVDGNYNFQFISIKDTLESSDPFQLLELFNKNETDIIILNWDSINGDPIYGSDKTYQFFNHYIPDLNFWVENGGIVILEAQTAAWKPVQDSYDTFAKKFAIRTTKKRSRGKCAIVNKKLIDQHPILRGLAEKIKLPETLPKRNWFPLNCGICSIDHSEERLYQGWFDKYSKDWEPLIFADIDKKKPIMLCRIVGKKDVVGGVKGGAYIITTMYIGASGLNQLINNLLSSPQHISEYYGQKENLVKRRRKREIIGISCILIVSFLLWMSFPIIIGNIGISQETMRWVRDIMLAISVICGIILVIFGPGVGKEFLSQSKKTKK